eukprot:Trichotokara_eunicae@DN6280_c0_g1_i6.p1
MRTVGKIDYPALPYFEDSNHMFKLVRHGYRMAFSKLQTTLYMRPGRTTLDENVAHKAKGGLGMDDNIEDCENAGGYMYCMLESACSVKNETARVKHSNKIDTIKFVSVLGWMLTVF